MINRLTFFSSIIYSLAFVFCNENPEKQTIEAHNDERLTTEIDSAIINNHPVIAPDSLTDSTDPICNCSPYLEKKYDETQTLTLNNKHFLEGDTTISSAIENNIEIKLLKFDNCKKIPNDVLHFSQVEKVIIRMSMSSEGLDLSFLDEFKTLKHVIIQTSTVLIDTNAAWMSRIRFLELRKVKTINLHDFEIFKTLNHLKIDNPVFHNSGFPSGLDKLDCIYSINIIETRSEIDQNLFDFAHSPCLQEYVFKSSYNTLKGIPFGLGKSLKSFDTRTKNLEENEKVRHQKIVSLIEN